MRTTAIRAIVGVLAVGGLSACQKSACDYTPNSNRITAADQMVSCLNSLPVTPTASMPQSGSATYSGFFASTLTPGSGPADTLIGDASLTANFTAIGGTVSGNVSNVASTANGDLSGTLAIAGGTIAGAVVLGANITGTLTATSSETLSFNGQMAGGFSGDAADGLSLATQLGGGPAVVTSSVTGAGTADIVVFGLK